MIPMPGPVSPEVEAEVRRRWRRTSVWLVLAWVVLPTALALPGCWMVITQARQGALDPGDVAMTAITSWVPFLVLLVMLFTGRLTAHLGRWFGVGVLVCFVMPFGIARPFGYGNLQPEWLLLVLVFTMPVLAAILLGLGRRQLVRPTDTALGGTPFVLTRSLRGRRFGGSVHIQRERLLVLVNSDTSGSKGSARARAQGRLEVRWDDVAAVGVTKRPEEVWIRRRDGRGIYTPPGPLLAVETEAETALIPVDEPEQLVELLRRRVRWATGRRVGELSGDPAGAASASGAAGATVRASGDATDTGLAGAPVAGQEHGDAPTAPIAPTAPGVLGDPGVVAGSPGTPQGSDEVAAASASATGHQVPRPASTGRYVGVDIDPASVAPLRASTLRRGLPVPVRYLAAMSLLVVLLAAVPVVALWLQGLLVDSSMGSLPGIGEQASRSLLGGIEAHVRLPVYAGWLLLTAAVLLGFCRRPHRWPLMAAALAAVMVVPSSLVSGILGSMFGVFGLQAGATAKLVGWLIPAGVVVAAYAGGWVARSCMVAAAGSAVGASKVQLRFGLRSAYETSGWAQDNTVDRIARRIAGRLLAGRESVGKRPGLELQADRVCLDHGGAPTTGGATARHAIPLRQLRMVQVGELSGPPGRWPLPDGYAVELVNGPALRLASADQQWVLPLQRPELVADLIRARCAARGRGRSEGATESVDHAEWQSARHTTGQEAESARRRPARGSNPTYWLIGAVLLTALTGASLQGRLSGDSVDFWYLGTAFYGVFAIAAWGMFVSRRRAQRVVEDHPVQPGAQPWGDPRPEYAPTPQWLPTSQALVAETS